MQIVRNLKGAGRPPRSLMVLTLLVAVMLTVSGCGFTAYKGLLSTEASGRAERNARKAQKGQQSKPKQRVVAVAALGVQQLPGGFFVLNSDGAITAYTASGTRLISQRLISQTLDSEGEPSDGGMGSFAGEEEQLLSAAFDLQSGRLALHRGTGSKGAILEVWKRGGSSLESEWSLVDRWQVAVPDVRAMAFSPTDDALLIGAGDGHAYLWKFGEPQPGIVPEFLKGARRQLVQRYIGHASPISSVTFHPSGFSFFTADAQGVLSAWRRQDADAFGGALDETSFGTRYQQDPAERRILKRREGEPVSKLVLSEGGEWLLLLSQSGQVELWRTRGMVLVHQFKAYRGLLIDADFRVGSKRSEVASISNRYEPSTNASTGSAPETYPMLGVSLLGRDRKIAEWQISPYRERLTWGATVKKVKESEVLPVEFLRYLQGRIVAVGDREIRLESSTL